MFEMVLLKRVDQYIEELPEAENNLGSCRSMMDIYIQTLKKALYFEESVEWIKLAHFATSNIRLHHLQKQLFEITKTVCILCSCTCRKLSRFMYIFINRMDG